MQAPFDIAADLDTPVSAYLKLRAFEPCFLLESVEGGERLGRYSFLGLGRALSLTLDGDALNVDGECSAPLGDGAELLAALREIRDRAPRLEPALPGVPLTGGLVGAAGYDLVRHFERLPGRPAARALVAIAPRSMLVFDHLTRRVALLHEGGEAERRALRGEVIRALRGPLPPRNGRSRVEEARPSLARREFLSRVSKVQHHIAAGDVYQLVLSVGFEGRCEVDPFEAYRALRLLNPSPYMYYCEIGTMTVAGSSPEALVRLNGRQAALRPIAGTRRRGVDVEEDLILERELVADPKENAEHVMLVDLARNDLGRVARTGTVKVDPYRAVERYSHVMHLVSGVCGELEPDRDAFDLFAASFPAGTLVGAPKVRAMELIAELEPEPRGLYGGTVGYFDRSGDMDQAIAIRTLTFEGGRYRYQAGAGIVADSVPEREHEEVLAKAAVLRRALELAGEGL